MHISVDERGDVIVRFKSSDEIPPGFHCRVTNKSEKLVSVLVGGNMKTINAHDGDATLVNLNGVQRPPSGEGLLDAVLDMIDGAGGMGVSVTSPGCECPVCQAERRRVPNVDHEDGN